MIEDRGCFHGGAFFDAVGDEFDDLTRRTRISQLSIPLRIATIREEMALFATWYNQHRPHRALDGRTPAECAAGTVAKSEPAQPEPNQRLTLVVGYLQGRRHLPVVQIRRAA